ncbi:hypothetical protein CQA49_08110 [Helicobacter sp. MIT 00-7814]|uniref:hypothetical protein n=1 Tax=unclassified Helicobacter TaxID=2593540 RepID=UPI000E1E4A7E|nr:MULTISPECIES: hypothetical protein [unclassified Helicobacter]RDU51717.1 hypothetical protein CQA37_09385 [Helicobacter sp. MIT 99-10781]RDU52569.1 hypothetical protein CQA49_08110 [Helicobacter sp. MIT 00-7814]
MAQNKPIKSEKSQNIDFNAQFNILIENELNAISKLNPRLANRAMKLLEDSLEHRKQCDKEIIELEKTNQKMQELETRKYYFWTGFGVFGFFFVFVLALCLGAFLAYFDKTIEAMIVFAIGFINILPKILRELRKKA